MSDLQGVLLIEKDVNNDLISWIFPSVDPTVEKVLKSRCGLNDPEYGPAFRFSRYGSCWQYFAWIAVADQNTKVLATSVVVLAQDFNPAKYKQVLAVLTNAYASNYSPLPVMQAYLTIFTKGSIDGKFGKFDSEEHDPKKALIAPVKKLLEMFGIEAVVIWVGMLLKKRIFVYSPNLGDLLAAVRAFPLFGAFHRQNWSILRPYCKLTETELEELNTLGVYVAGFTDPACESQTKYYDLFIDIGKSSFTIAEHAKGDFVLTKFHKTTAETFRAAAQEGNDQAVIKAMIAKTKELITNVESLKTDHTDGSYITLEELSSRKLPANMAKFLYNVAQAEGMAK